MTRWPSMASRLGCCRKALATAEGVRGRSEMLAAHYSTLMMSFYAPLSCAGYMAPDDMLAFHGHAPRSQLPPHSPGHGGGIGGGLEALVAAGERTCTRC